MNTQEKEPELGEGITSAEYWMYDGKLGRRWNVDPVDQIFISNYAVNANNPVYFIDPFGNFKTKFGAYVYKIFHGGKVKKAQYGEHKGEWFVYERIKSGAGRKGRGRISDNSFEMDGAKIIEPVKWGWHFPCLEAVKSEMDIYTKDALSHSQKDETEWVKNVNTFNVGVGSITTLVENLSGKASIGNNFKFYRSGWYGNQYVYTFKVSSIAKNLGHSTLLFGSILDFYGVRNYYKYGPANQYAVHPAKAGLNFSVGLWGLMNPATAVGATGFFIIDTFYPGGFDAALKMNASIEHKNQAILGARWNLYRDY
jgi:hypothetical protein